MLGNETPWLTLQNFMLIGTFLSWTLVFEEITFYLMATITDIKMYYQQMHWICANILKVKLLIFFQLFFLFFGMLGLTLYTPRKIYHWIKKLETSIIQMFSFSKFYFTEKRKGKTKPELDIHELYFHKRTL